MHWFQDVGSLPSNHSKTFGFPVRPLYMWKKSVNTPAAENERWIRLTIDQGKSTSSLPHLQNIHHIQPLPGNSSRQIPSQGERYNQRVFLSPAVWSLLRKSKVNSAQRVRRSQNGGQMERISQSELFRRGRRYPGILVELTENNRALAHQFHTRRPKECFACSMRAERYCGTHELLPYQVNRPTCKIV